MILIALGANLASSVGPPPETLRAGLAALAQRGVEIAKLSRFYLSEAWPDPKDPPYINAVARVDTALPPRALMGLLHEVEAAFGRERGVANAPRTLDLDLIDYNGLIEAGDLALPHPRVLSRAFVLLPLADVAPDWVHPVTQVRVQDAIAALPPSRIEILP